MSEIALQRFACEACAKSYKWKPELSLKRVRCKCGATMTVPDLTPPVVDDDAPPTLPDGDDDIFAMIESAPAGKSQAERLLVAAAAAPAGKVPVARAAPARPGAKPATLSYRPAGPQKTGPQQTGPQRRGGIETFHDIKRDVYLPTGLIAGSLCVYFAWLAIHGPAAHAGPLGAYGAGLFAMIGIKTVLLIAGAFVVAPLAGVSFGPIWTAILKLVALTATTDILVTLISQISPGGGMTIATSLAGVFCYWGLLCLLFDMDLAEARRVASLFGLMRFALTIGLVMLFMSGTIHAGSDGYVAPTPSEAAAQVDEAIAERVESGHTEEGLAYIKRTTREDEQQALIQKAYAAGATDVFFTVSKDINGHAEPLSLVVEWPRNAAKRVAVLSAVNAAERDRAALVARNRPEWGKMRLDTYADDGGKYLELSLGP